MREMKCKAWDNKSKKIRKVDSVAFDDEGNIKVVNCWGKDIIEQKRIIVHREPPNVVVLWYTGLKDKNGKEIYEGDIVKGKFYFDDGRSLIPIRGEVVYENTLSAFSLKNKGGITLMHRLAENYIEKIGNKYENGDLL